MQQFHVLQNIACTRIVIKLSGNHYVVVRFCIFDQIDTIRSISLILFSSIPRSTRFREQLSLNFIHFFIVQFNRYKVDIS